MKIPPTSYLLFLLLSSAMRQSSSQNHHRYLAQNDECIVAKMVVMFKNGTKMEKWNCELQGSDVASTGKTFVDIEGFDATDLSIVRSGNTTLLPGQGYIVNGTLKLPPGSKKGFGKAQGRGPAAKGLKKLKNANSNGVPNARRILAAQERKVLAVRVKANDASTTSSISTIGDKIFGTSGDVVNLKERIESCSYRDVIMTPFSGATTTGTQISNGVYEVTVNVNVAGRADGDVTNDVTAALEARLGTLSTQFDHVMLCLPPGTSGNWGAWAYVNHYLSVYNDIECNYPSGDVHEIGHNLNLQHGWYNNIEYADKTGFMGYSYNDDTTRMCYNAAHSWQLGWYPLQRISLDIANGGPFAGQLIGISDYQSAGSAGKYVLVRVTSSTFSKAVYVGFNLQRGINNETKDALNQVTVHTQAGVDKTDLVAKLSAGGSYTIANFQNGETLHIDVKSINTAIQPAVANVEVYLGACAPSSTTCGIQCNQVDACVAVTIQNNACVYNTAACPGNFVIQFRTDDYPQETSWQVVDVCSGNTTVFSGGSYTSANTNVSQSKVIGKSRYRLRFLDTYGDGLCCGTNGPTSFSATLDGLSVAAGSGNFGGEAAFEFGSSSCVAPSPPTLAPVPKPTPAPILPTLAPVPKPTPAPILPTLAPVPKPTPAPILPTLAPVPKPTPAPILPTLAPVPKPTPAPVLPTLAPVPKPTPAPILPTLAPVTSSATFSWSLKTDSYPGETTWKVIDRCTGVTVLSGGPYATGNTVFSGTKSLVRSSYSLQVLDSYGDGLCCGTNGATSFTASYGGVSVGTIQGNFGSNSTLTFGSACVVPTAAPVPKPTPAPVLPTVAPVPKPTPAPILPTAAPVAPSLQFAWTLKTDSYPGETTWKVVNRCTGATVLSGGPYATGNTFFNGTTSLVNSAYSFQLLDSYGDGLCCGTNGATSFTATYGGVSIGTIQGNFGSLSTLLFGISCPV